MRNFNKLANLHNMFFKRADEKTFAPGHFSPDINKPGPGNIDAQAAHATSKANAQNAADDRAMRANYNVTPTPGSASGHEVITPKRNLGISPTPPKPGPVSTYKNQGLTPKPWSLKHAPADPYDAAAARNHQWRMQKVMASPYGKLLEDGTVLRGEDEEDLSGISRMLMREDHLPGIKPPPKSPKPNSALGIAARENNLQ